MLTPKSLPSYTLRHLRDQLKEFNDQGLGALQVKTVFNGELMDLADIGINIRKRGFTITFDFPGQKWDHNPNYSIGRGSVKSLLKGIKNWIALFSGLDEIDHYVKKDRAEARANALECVEEQLNHFVQFEVVTMLHGSRIAKGNVVSMEIKEQAHHIELIPTVEAPKPMKKPVSPWATA